MARIILATFGSLGDLHPVVALALKLRERGHQPEIATVVGYREKISALELPFHPLRPELSLSDEALIRRIVDRVSGPQYLLRDILLANVRAMHTDLLAATQGADLLVTSELVYAAPVVAEQLGLPRVSYALAPLSYLPTHDAPVMPLPIGGGVLRALPPWVMRGLNAAADIVTHGWWRPVRELRAVLGLGPGRNPISTGKFSPNLDLALFSSALQPPQPDWPRQTVQTGFLFYDEADAASTLPTEVEQFLAEGEPPIVFTLGSSAVYAADRFYEESAQAAVRLGRRALLLIGNNPRPAGLPATILAWDYLPYAHVFPRASVIVHSGGVGTTAQAMRAGRPTLVMPFAFDQFDNAARITRLGAGRTTPRGRYNATTATRAIASLFDDATASATAERLAERIRAEDGVATACSAIERLLEAN